MPPVDPIEDVADDTEVEDIIEGDELDDAGDDSADDPDGEDGGSVDSTEAGAPAEDVARPRSRATERVERALADAKEARERAEAAERRLAALEQGRTQTEEAQREAKALEAMDPYERNQFLSEKALRETRGEVAALRRDMADTADRTDFASKAARNPALAAVADDVEKALATMRANGTTAPRETVAAYLIGQRALARAGGAKTRAAKAGAGRIAAATAKPGGGARSDVRPERPGADTAAARKARLENMQI